MEYTVAGLERLIKESTSDAINAALRDHKGAIDEGLAPMFQSQNKFPELLAAAKTGQGARGSDAIGLLLRSYAAAGGDVQRAKDYATKLGRGDAADKVAKALGAGTGAGGGFLIEGELADEVIDALRSRSAVRSLNPMKVLAPRGTLDFPRLDSSATAGYVAENSDIQISSETFGKVILSAKKLAGLVVVSNDLLRFTGGDADAIVRDDLLKVLAAVEDINFIRGDGIGGGPQGLRYWAAAANVFAANASATLANVTADLLKAIDAMEGADVPLLRGGWIMSPRSKNFLMSLRDGNGNLAFQPEMSRGTLMGIPFRITTHIPNNLGGGSDSEVYLADFSEVILGEVSAIELEASNVAAYLDEGSALRSAFSRDQTVVRAILRHDLAVKHPEAVAVITDVPWVLS